MLGIHKLLVVYCDYGRLGNRLHTHANALAWCIENNYNLINLSFFDYAELFKSSPKHNSGNINQNKNFIFKCLSCCLFRNFLQKLLLSDKWLVRLAWIFNQIRPANSELLREDDLNLQINQKKINLIKHWDISCKNSIGFQRDKLRDYLCPKNRFIVSAEKIIKELRSKYDCVVGVHARRGDYKEYLNGLHFHSWESYKLWIFQLKKLLQSKGKKKIGFLICSDEVPNSSIFSESFIHNPNYNHYMSDLHALSLCDYLIGPPSLFGTWISWFGNTPRFIIERNSTIKSLTEFQIEISP